MGAALTQTFLQSMEDCYRSSLSRIELLALSLVMRQGFLLNQKADLLEPNLVRLREIKGFRQFLC